MELIKDFGIDPILLGAQIVNFLIVLLILRRFLYKPILEMLKKRQNIIKEGIQKSEDASAKLAKTLEDEKSILKNAQSQAKKIIEDAKNQMLEQSRQMEENTKNQAEKIFKDTQEQIKQEAKETEKRLTLNISNLAVKFLEKSLKDVFSEKEQEEIIRKAVQKIKG